MIRFNTALTMLDVIDGEVYQSDGQRFDRESYSRFKYGWLPPAAEYGRDLASLIAVKLWCVSEGRPIRIVSAPYKFLPTASHAIAENLRDRLGEMAVEQGTEPPVLVPLYKAQVGDSSYARSDASARKSTLKSLGLRIDESLVPGSVILVVDDIRITGAAEQATAAYLEPLSPHAIWYLHAARLSSDVAALYPGLEDELNQSVRHSLTTIPKEVAAGEFQLNTRVLRFILEQAPGSLECFLMMAQTWLIEQIYHAAVGSGTDYCNRHARNLAIVKDELSERQPERMMESCL